MLPLSLCLTMDLVTQRTNVCASHTHTISWRDTIFSCLPKFTKDTLICLFPPLFSADYTLLRCPRTPEQGVIGRKQKTLGALTHFLCYRPSGPPELSNPHQHKTSEPQKTHLSRHRSPDIHAASKCPRCRRRRPSQLGPEANEWASRKQMICSKNNKKRHLDATDFMAKRATTAD